jgi:hypothetical protein
MDQSSRQSHKWTRSTSRGKRSPVRYSLTWDSEAKVSAIEPTLLIEDEGTFEETDVDFGTVEGTDIKEEYGSWSADFLITNPTDEPLESPAVRVACRNAAGTIIGGGFDFPDLVPPNGSGRKPAQPHGERQTSLMHRIRRWADLLGGNGKLRHFAAMVIRHRLGDRSGRYG